MGLFASLFGYLLNFLYNLIGNYAWSIILFCVIIKLLMLPLSIKQQKNMKATAKLQEQMKILQFKYKNDPEKLNQEMMALYKKENISPFSGCFSAIIQIVLLLSIFYLVRSPLTYMRKIDSDIISACYNVLKQENKVSESAYKEMDIIREISFIEDCKNKEKSEDKEISNEENKSSETNEDIEISQETESNETNKDIDKISQENIEKIKINMNFFGIDLSKVPTQNADDWKVYIIPVLYVIMSFVSMRFINSVQNGKKKDKEQEENPMLQANKQMSYIFPIIYLSVTLVAPLGLALYWLVNSILMIVEKIILNFILKEKDDEEDGIKYISEKSDKKEEE